MRIVKAVAIAKRRQGNMGCRELLTWAYRPFEWHQISVVKDSDPNPFRVIPATDLRPLHIAGHFADDGKPDSRPSVCNEQPRILGAPGVEDLTRDDTILRFQGGFVLGADRRRAPFY